MDFEENPYTSPFDVINDVTPRHSLIMDLIKRHDGQRITPKIITKTTASMELLEATIRYEHPNVDPHFVDTLINETANSYISKLAEYFNGGVADESLTQEIGLIMVQAIAFVIDAYGDPVNQITTEETQAIHATFLLRQPQIEPCSQTIIQVANSDEDNVAGQVIDTESFNPQFQPETKQWRPKTKTSHTVIIQHYSGTGKNISGDKIMGDKIFIDINTGKD